MLDDILKEIISSLVGKQSEEIADLLNSKTHVNEFAIAKKLNLTINQTRNILYKVSNYGLVSSVRKKDKKKGWYTYYWKFENLKALEFLKENLLKKISEAKAQIKEREKKIYYVCNRCNIEVEEEVALIKDFTCEECGEVFVVKDNSSLIKELNKSVLKLEEKLNSVDEEIQKEKSKLEKTRFKEIEKERKEKEKLRLSKRIKNKKEIKKKNPEKKESKKESKKSVKKISKVPSKKLKPKKIKNKRK